MTLSANRIIIGASVFLAVLFVLDILPDDTRAAVLPLLLIAVFLRSAVKAPPIAIAILLYYSMILGSWLIVLAAPGTMMLARRYQRRRLALAPTRDHVRRTLLLAAVAMLATLPFAGASLGPWSNRSQSSSARSASPLNPQEGRGGEETVLQRFARWLGFGPDPDRFGQGDPLESGPVGPPPQPDDPFNWWIVVVIAIILGLALLAWWLWRRRKPAVLPAFVATPARPLARLEAVGERVGRPRAPFEGAITYGRALARVTGDARLAEAGPLVSSEVYQSAFANPGQVDANLRGIESAPPPAAPTPSFRKRLRTHLAARHISVRALIVGLFVVGALVAVGWIVIPRLGDLGADDFESGVQQLQIVPSAAQDIVYH